MTPQQMAELHALAFTKDRAWSAKEFALLLEQPAVFAVGDEIAFALGRVALDEAELLTLATRPALRRQGLGRRRLVEYEDEARRRGATRSILEVAADNRAAVRLYDSSGYALAARRPAYYRRDNGLRVDALVLARCI